MKITYYGHGCLAVEVNNKHLLIDPFITGNPLAKHLNIDSIPADYILITHAHQDHILDVESIAKRTGAKLISNYEIVMHYGAKEFDGHPLNHGGACTFDGIQIKYVNAIHTSSFPDGSYGGQPGGFVIAANNKTVYIAGDTALTFDMKLIPMQYSIDLAVLPIGDNFTMGAADAVIASEFVSCDRVLGCHYDTFPPIVIDKEKAAYLFSEKGKELHLLEIGASMQV
jgi:L-ascorbate metabolism protein UlaG (beta-lactamase superfamily)